MKKLFALLVVFSLAAIGCEEKKSYPAKPDTSKTPAKTTRPTRRRPDHRQDARPREDANPARRRTRRDETTKKAEKKKGDGGPDLGKEAGRRQVTLPSRLFPTPYTVTCRYFGSTQPR